MPDEDLPVDEAPVVVPSYFGAQQMAQARVERADPSIASQGLSGLGYILGTLARPTQTMIHGIATGDKETLGDAFESIYNPAVAKDFTDIRRDVIGKADVEDQDWFSSPGNFAQKLGIGAVDLAGNVVTDPLTLVNPLSLTKAGVAMRGIKEGVEAEVLSGGKNLLREQAARQALREGDLVAARQAEIVASLDKNSLAEAAKNGLTPDQIAEQLAKNQQRAFDFATESAAHAQIAPRYNQELRLVAKEHGIPERLLPEWHAPEGATFKEIEQSLGHYKEVLNDAVENLVPDRLGDQVNAGQRTIMGIGNPFSEANSGVNFGLKDPGAALNKLADFKNGIVQTMEATTVGRGVLDAKDWIAQSILNPAGRGANAMLERVTQTAGAREQKPLYDGLVQLQDALLKTGMKQEDNGLVSELFTVYGVKEAKQEQRAAELMDILSQGKTVEQRKSFATAADAHRDLMEKVRVYENKYGVVKDDLSTKLEQTIQTIKDREKEIALRMPERDEAARQINLARSEIAVVEGNLTAAENLNKQRLTEQVANEVKKKRFHNDGVVAQRGLESRVLNRPELKAAIDEVAALKVQRAALTDPLAVKQISLEIADKNAAIKAMNAQSDEAIQAVRSMAHDSGDAAAFYNKTGLSVDHAMSLGNNRVAVNAGDLAGLPRAHAAETVHALRHGLSPVEGQSLKDGLMHTGAPLPNGNWLNQVAGADPSLLNQAAYAEELLKEHFDKYLRLKVLPHLDFAAPFAKMEAMLNRQADLFQLGEARAIPKLKTEVVGSAEKIGPKFPKPRGLADAQLMHLDEFISESEKIAGPKFVGPIADDPILKQGMADAHASLVKTAIERGESVPRAVLESHGEMTPAFAKGGKLWNENEVNWKRGGGITENVSVVGYRNQLAADLERAEKSFQKYNDLPTKAVFEKLQAEIKLFEQAVKDTPNYVLSSMSEDAMRKLVGSRQMGLVKLHYAEIERQFADTLRPLSHSEVNALIAGKPHFSTGVVTADGIKGVAAVGGELPEATVRFGKREGMPVGLLLGAWNPGENDFKELAKAATRLDGKTVTVEAVKAMPVAKRIKYYQQAYGKFFEERPEVLAALRIDEATKAVKSKTYIDGIRDLFAKKIPFKDMSEADIADRANTMKRYKELLTTASTSDEKAALRAMRKSLVENDIRMTPGYVDAELIHPDLKGHMVKRDVFDQAVRYLDGMKDPAWMKGMFAHLSGANSWWKTLQLSVPGAWIRDWLGNVMLRFQNNGFHLQTATTDASGLWKVFGSGGDAAKLKDIAFNFPSGKMTGEEFWNHMLDQGILGHGAQREIVEESMKGLAERGSIGRKAVNVRKKLLDMGNYLQEKERMDMFHSRLAMGDTMAAAGAATDAAIYNYGRVSPFVNFTRKTGLIPFATWSSKNIPAQLQLMIEHPGQFAALLHAKRAWEGQVPGGPSQAEYPEYVRDKWNLTVKRDPDTGDIGFLTLSGLIPMADLASVESPGQFLSEVMGPIPKSGFESLFNIDLFTRKEMERYDGELTPIFKDDPDSLLISKKTSNVFNQVVGRPANIVNDLLGIANGAKDKYGNAKTPGALNSALFGIIPKERSGNKIREDQQREADDLARNMGVVKKAMMQASGRPGGERAYQAYQAQLIKLQEKRAEMISARR